MENIKHTVNLQVLFYKMKRDGNRLQLTPQTSKNPTLQSPKNYTLINAKLLNYFKNKSVFYLKAKTIVDINTILISNILVSKSKLCNKTN